MSDIVELLVRAAAEPPAAESDPTAAAIVAAALRQFELFGVARSTMDDIARRAKVARITLYRHFPGREALVEAVMLHEMRRFLADLDAAVQQHDVDDRVAEGFVFVLDAIRNHRLLQRVLESEPETILAPLLVDGAPLAEAARAFLAARLIRDHDDGRPAEEMLVVADVMFRLMLSFMLNPRAPLDLEDPEVARAFARRYIVPIMAGPTAS